MALVDGDDLVLRYDRKRIADLVSDAGIRTDTATVADHAIVGVLIDDAIEMLKSAMRVAARYTDDDLRLYPAPDANDEGKPLVKRLVCDLAFGLLNARKGYAADEMAKLAPRYGEAMGMLQQLRDGDRILDSDDHADAGLPASEPFRPLGSLAPPLLADSGRFFGTNPARYPTSRW